MEHHPWNQVSAVVLQRRQPRGCSRPARPSRGPHQPTGVDDLLATQDRIAQIRTTRDTHMQAL